MGDVFRILYDSEGNEYFEISEGPETQVCVDCFLRKPRNLFEGNQNVCNDCRSERGEI